MMDSPLHTVLRTHHLSSRVHKLNHFPNEHTACYVKRDDELGCGINGTKLRKYASLVPFLLSSNIRHLIIIAGPQSNNLLAALQTARELQLKVTLFLLKSHQNKIQGNFKLSSLFINEDEIIWLGRDCWPDVNQLAQSYAQQLPEPAFVLNEGASVSEALAGAMTLADDIITNEQELGLNFQHIFIDAGTGFSACALIKRMAQLHHNAVINILLLADDEPTFIEKLTQWTGMSFSNYRCILPQNARSFGSVNATVKNEVMRMAREEGILADPIYSAKLFAETRGYIKNHCLTGNILLVHSGGTLTMPAFDYN